MTAWRRWDAVAAAGAVIGVGVSVLHTDSGGSQGPYAGAPALVEKSLPTKASDRLGPAPEYVG